MATRLSYQAYAVLVADCLEWIELNYKAGIAISDLYKRFECEPDDYLGALHVLEQYQLIIMRNGRLYPETRP